MSNISTVRSTMRSVRVSHATGAKNVFGVLGYIRGQEYCNGVKVNKPHSPDEVIGWGSTGLDSFGGKAETLIDHLNAAEITKSGTYQQRGKQPPELFKHLDLTIPHGVSPQRAMVMVKELADDIRDNHGVAVVYAVHAKDGQPNDCHFLISKRLVDDEGKVGNAARSLATNPNARGFADNPVNVIRQKWADLSAREAGVEWSIQSYNQRGIEKEKEPKLSNKIRAIRKRETGVDPLDELKAKRTRKDLTEKISDAKNWLWRKFNKKKAEELDYVQNYEKRQKEYDALRRKADIKNKAHIKLKAEKDKKEDLNRAQRNHKIYLESAEFWVKQPKGAYNAYYDRLEKELKERKEKAERERTAEIEANKAKHAEIERRKNEMPFVDKDGFTVRQSEGLEKDKQRIQNKILSRGRELNDEERALIKKNNDEMLKPRQTNRPTGRSGGRGR